MHIFTLNRSDFTDGKIINGLDSITWVERYNKAGEFTITAKPTEQIMSDLTLGTFISHEKTANIMVVENLFIDGLKDGEDKLTITGRTVDAYIMENRITATTNIQNFSTSMMVFEFNPWDYVLPAAYPWEHVLRLIRKHVVDANYYLFEVARFEEEVPFTAVYNLVSPTGSYVAGEEIVPLMEERSPSKNGTVYAEVLSLLDLADIGLKLERPTVNHTTLDFIIHRGVRRDSQIRFSYNDGDLLNAKYLWTNKFEKNASWVSSSHYGAYWRQQGLKGTPPKTGWDHKVGSTDASDWEMDYKETLTAMIGNGHAARVSSVLANRAKNDISKKKKRLLVEAKISPNTEWEYNKDYFMGDVVFVDGDYGIGSPMRVVEYARTLDSNGEEGYPTLTEIPLNDYTQYVDP